MHNSSASHKSEHHDFPYEQHPLSRHEPKSRSPVELENARAGKLSKGSGSSSARVSRKSSKSSSKEPKVARSSPESEDPSLHRREQHDQDDVYRSKSSGFKFDEEDTYSSQKSAGPNLDQDAPEFRKPTIQKSSQSSRKTLIDKHHGESTKSLHHVAFSENEARKPQLQPSAEE